MEEKRIIRIDRNDSIYVYSINEIGLRLKSKDIALPGNSISGGTSTLPRKATKILPGKASTKEKKKRLKKEEVKLYHRYDCSSQFRLTKPRIKNN